MNEPNKAKTDVADAVQQVVQQTAAANAPPPPETLAIQGPTLWTICNYVGTKPYIQVAELRRGLFAIQQETGCISPQQLPPMAVITHQTASTLRNWLVTQPFDEVFQLIEALEADVAAHNQRVADQQKAAQEAIDSANATLAAEAAAAAAGGDKKDPPAAAEGAAGSPVAQDPSPGSAVVEAVVVSDRDAAPAGAGTGTQDNQASEGSVATVNPQVDQPGS